MKNLLVMKFGGTSMGSAERIKTASKLAHEQLEQRPVVVVVSAMSKITDLLLDTLRRAEGGDSEAVEANLRQLAERHLLAAGELLSGPALDECVNAIEDLVAEFSRIVNGVRLLAEGPPRAIDEAVAIGEQLSALLMAAHLQKKGVRAKAVNAREVIVTDAVFGNATPLMGPTTEKAARVLRPLVNEGVLPVVTGFNGATPDGRPTTLGRGGSDFSASILSAALDAEELWIWTDVDGIMTADPRIVPDPAVLDEVTYREAAELAYNGAKVLHPRTLAPLVERQIPVWSKNSFAPEKPGTKIVPEVKTPPGPRAVTSMAKVALISMEPASAEISGTRLMGRALDALSSTSAELLAITSSSYRQSFCFLVRKEELSRAVEALESSLSLELAHGYLKPIDVDDNVGLLAVVGEGMRGAPGLAGRIFTAISREKVNIIAIAQGSSELTIAIVVAREGLDKAVRAIHSECKMGELARRH
ncbi:MAG: aspartate kinase [Bryobacterales bacterium]|nr:aspartate kinase [Bryobacterales bacterium]